MGTLRGTRGTIFQRGLEGANSLEGRVPLNCRAYDKGPPTESLFRARRHPWRRAAGGIAGLGAEEAGLGGNRGGGGAAGLGIVGGGEAAQGD